MGAANVSIGIRDSSRASCGELVQLTAWLRRTDLHGVLCGNETTAVYEFQPESVDYFRRGRRRMVRPRMEAIPVRPSHSTSATQAASACLDTRAPFADGCPRHNAWQISFVQD